MLFNTNPDNKQEGYLLCGLSELIQYLFATIDVLPADATRELIIIMRAHMRRTPTLAPWVTLNCWPGYLSGGRESKTLPPGKILATLRNYMHQRPN